MTDQNENPHNPVIYVVKTWIPEMKCYSIGIKYLEEKEAIDRQQFVEYVIGDSAKIVSSRFLDYGNNTEESSCIIISL